MTRDFSDHFPGLSDPAENAASVTPNDSTDLPGGVCRSLYIGGAGTGALSVVMMSGTTIAFAGLTANTILPIRVSRVRSTGTGVTGIIALY